MNKIFATALNRLRFVGILEGISYIVLIICSVIKRLFEKPEVIKIPGMIHGVLFILFVIVLIDAHVTYKWTIKKSILAFVASLLPLGNFWADAKLFKE